MKEFGAYVQMLYATGELSGWDYDWRGRYEHIFKTIEVPTGNILDIGSNECGLQKWFIQQNILRNVVSLDIRDLKPTNSNFVKATGRALPFKSNSFDNVVSFYALPCFSTDKAPAEVVLNEMVIVARETVIVWPVPDNWFVGQNSTEGKQKSIAGVVLPLTNNLKVEVYNNPQLKDPDSNTDDSFILVLRKVQT